MVFKKKLYIVQKDGTLHLGNMIIFTKARTLPAQLTSLHIKTKVCVVLSHSILFISRNNQTYQDLSSVASLSDTCHKLQLVL